MADRTADRLDIIELTNRYAFAMLDKDWDAWLACFADGAQVDYTTAGAVKGSPAEMVEFLKNSFAFFDVSINRVSNQVVDFVSDDEATGRCVYVVAMRIPGDQPTYMEASGWYADRFARTADGWRISERVEHMLYLR